MQAEVVARLRGDVSRSSCSWASSVGAGRESLRAGGARWRPRSARARIPTTARAICAGLSVEAEWLVGDEEHCEHDGHTDEEDLQLPALFSVRAADADNRGGERSDSREEEQEESRRVRARPRRRRRPRFRAGSPPLTERPRRPGREDRHRGRRKHDRTPAATPTIHQRRVGGRPVGKSSGTIVTTRTKLGTKSRSLASEATEEPATSRDA